jgi:hypothetical protein
MMKDIRWETSEQSRWKFWGELESEGSSHFFDSEDLIEAYEPEQEE